MRWAPAATSAVVLLLVSVGAAACATSHVDSDEIDRWMNGPMETPDGSLAAMSGRVGRGDPEPGAGEGVTATFERPVRVDGVLLSCHGEDTVSFMVEVTTGTGVLTHTLSDVPCAEGVHEEALAAGGATSVRVDGFVADRDGAWRVVVLGSEPD